MTPMRLYPLTLALGTTVTFLASTFLSPGSALADPGESLSRACGSPLSNAEVDRVAELSDVTTLTGAGLPRLETAVERHREITSILVSHHDWRGLFSVGLDAVEPEAVMPLRRAPTTRPRTEIDRGAP